MSIDWFTFLAQSVNFLILVFLLNRFLYKPVRSVMQKRKELVEGKLQEAQEKEEAGRKTEEKYRKLLSELESEKEKIRSDVKAEVNQWKLQLQTEASGEVEKMKERWEENLETEIQLFREKALSEFSSQVRQAAQRILKDLSGAELQEFTLQQFLHRIENLESTERSQLETSWKKSQEIQILSAIEFSEAQKEEIRSALQKQFTVGTPTLQFSLNPDLILGLEIRTLDQKVSWSAKEYLDELFAIHPKRKF